MSRERKRVAQEKKGIMKTEIRQNKMAKRVDKFNNSAKCERRKAEKENRRRGKGKVSLKNNDKSKEKLRVQ